MGKILRQHQLTGCRRCLPLHQATSCSCSMHLTSTTMGARTCILVTHATRGKMKTAVALECTGQRPPHDAFVYVEVDQRAPNAVRHIVHCIEAMRMCLRIGWTRMRSVTASMIGPPLTLRELSLSHS